MSDGQEDQSCPFSTTRTHSEQTPLQHPRPLHSHTHTHTAQETRFKHMLTLSAAPGEANHTFLKRFTLFSCTHFTPRHLLFGVVKLITSGAQTLLAYLPSIAMMFLFRLQPTRAVKKGERPTARLREGGAGRCGTVRETVWSKWFTVYSGDSAHRQVFKWIKQDLRGS